MYFYSLNIPLVTIFTYLSAMATVRHILKFNAAILFKGTVYFTYTHSMVLLFNISVELKNKGG